MNSPRVFLVVPLALVLLQGTPTVRAACYFPVEYHGTFVIQTQTSAAFGHASATFSEITIEADAIPPWGRCDRRRGNNVILKDSTGGEDCMRCFHLTLKTPNVIQIHTEGLGKCYTKEDAVRATCPDDQAVHERRFKEIMLYRKQMPDMVLPTAENVFCPVSGKFRFTYSANNGEFLCDQSLSELSNCPVGNGLAVRFRQCSFPDMDVNFQCLGDWESSSGDRYLALMDFREETETRSKYRCGMYRQDSVTGRVHVALSADSTCHTQLRSAIDGYETLVLIPFPERSLPAQVQRAGCRFPDWAQGHWENLHINSHVLVHHDDTRLQRVTSRCLRRENNTPNDRFIVFSATHCGQESYNCIWLKKRGQNVLQFQLGSRSSNVYSDDLCDDQKFHDDSWQTQGRRTSLEPYPCPITGDYSGIVPGTTGLCAKVASDCNNPDIMFYTVSSCENRSHVYEEREYRCLGSWEDGGVMYTYTQRRDMEGFQCFSGKVLHSGKEAYIKEAGDSCLRGEDPFVYGMKITKQSECSDSPPLPVIPVRTTQQPELPPDTVYGWSTEEDPFRQDDTERPTMKPKKPITESPDQQNNGVATRNTSVPVCILMSAFILLTLRRLWC